MSDHDRDEKFVAHRFELLDAVPAPDIWSEVAGGHQSAEPLRRSRRIVFVACAAAVIGLVFTLGWLVGRQDVAVAPTSSSNLEVAPPTPVPTAVAPQDVAGSTIPFETTDVPAAVSSTTLGGTSNNHSIDTSSTSQPISALEGGVDGPVITRRYVEEEDGLDALAQGVLVLDGDCLLLRTGDAAEERGNPLLWPYGTTWQADTATVLLPTGEQFTIGRTVELTGGFISMETVEFVVPDDAALHAVTECGGLNTFTVN